MGKKERKNVFAKKLLGMSVIQFVLSATVLIIIASICLMSGMRSEAIDGLKKMAKTIQIAYNTMDSGDYYVNEDKELVKGNLNITEEQELLNTYAKETDSEITYFYGDTRAATTIIKADGTSFIGTKASEEVVKQVLEGQNEYSDYNITINEKQYYAYYMPVKNADGSIAGMLFVGKECDKINTFIRTKILTIVAFAVLMIVAFSFASYFIVKKFAHGIIVLENLLRNLENGELNIEIKENLLVKSDEIGAIARAVNSVIVKLKTVVGVLNQSCETLLSEGGSLEGLATHSSSTAEDISRAIDEIAKGAVTQASDVELATENVVNMGSLIEQISNDISDLNNITEAVLISEEEANDNMNQLSESNVKTTEAINRIARNIEKTDDSVQKISDALQLITKIADETNLLSLNASIEAARAGEAGRGFSVVATQIQKLAEESNASAGRINEIIEMLAEDSATSVEVMNEVQGHVKEQEEKLEDTKIKIVQVSKGIKQCNQNAEAINRQAKECNASRVVVMDVIQNLSAMSQENAAATEETTASMEELAATIHVVSEASQKMQELSTTLSKEVKFFKM
ncbi:methyl-accepting chemotaxis protein [Anaerosporobacter sp.]|uniref:methyl-accepting chemotaxis protein n=1 Tax=Anaerosporobacter sp. TaxID=1872529 RepID=UPI00286F3BFF|nr:methyl-accepting chemotaxis protein [Anaerosporobacter sp.]